ncbi:inosine 5'-monophosphate dehydrogenase [Stieleria maiorica]|uniref:Inosine 5'-monophosphate dehydrogenase n=1 Tax=Stieleria maiorica TaxID=2795974 RepID=A0A5B9MPF5_9BACT|nr:CBS domain-containing protein [Stieleria maiorica]QEG01625.1 inosine 5'-monophosphate dehydrogenase [Stieleria maiorica]
MMPNTCARDMMVSNLTTLSPDMDVLEALDVLLRHRISGAPVVDRDDRFLGIFSEKSCIRFVVDAAYEQMPTNNLMSFVDRDPPTIEARTDLLTIAQTFLDASCRRLPVLDANRRLLGQISRRDVMREVRDHLNKQEPVATGAGLYLSAVVDGVDRPFRAAR